MFPALKALDVALSGLFLSFCPWTDIGNNARIIKGAQTLFYAATFSAFVGLFYAFSKGWKLIEKSISCLHWVIIAFLEIATYLGYTIWLKFYTDDDGHATEITLAITCMYIVFVIVTTRNFLTIVRKLNKTQASHNPYSDTVNSLKLKNNMVTCLMTGCWLFCFS